MKTLIVAIVDESGSMATKLNDVIGGWNTFLKTQQEVKDDEGVLILAKFNTRVTVVEEGVLLAAVKPFTTETYTPGGNTALYDAIAESIRLADKQTFDRAIALIITDGEENSSRETTMEQVKQIIQGYTARGNWTFTYIGEQPEKWARQTGTFVGNIAQYQHRDPGKSFVQAAQATTQMRASEVTASVSFYDQAFKTGDLDPHYKQPDTTGKKDDDSIPPFTAADPRAQQAADPGYGGQKAWPKPGGPDDQKDQNA